MIGVVLEVGLEPVRAFLVEPAAEDDTSLAVTEGAPFAVAGVEASLDGVTYGIVSVQRGAGADDPDVLVLDGPVTADVEAGEPVDVSPLIEHTFAVVELPDGTVEESVLVDQDLQAQKGLAPGVYEGADRPVVTLTFRDGQHVIVGVDGRGALDGANIVPGTVPVPEPDPPESSPAVTVTGTAESLVVEAEAVHASVFVQYHVSADPEFEPVLDGPTAVGPPTRSSVAVILEAGGLPLALDTPYYVRAIATNEAGTAEPGPVASASLNPDAVAEIIAARLVAGFVLAGQIQVGGIEITPDGGIVIPQPGDRQIRFPTDGSPAEIGGNLLALSITILDKLTIQGLDNLIAAGARVVVASGVSAPRRGPELSRFYPNADLIPGDVLRPHHRGLIRHVNDDGWVTTIAVYGGGLRFFGDDGVNFGLGNDWGVEFEPDGGVTLIGSDYYVLGVGKGGGPRDGRWFVKQINATTFTETNEWEWVPSSSRTKRPVIGTDGTNLVIAWANTGGSGPRIIVRRFTTGGTDVDVTECTGGMAAPPDLSSVHWGTQTGATRIVITATRTVLAYNTSGTRQTASEWSAAGTANILGMGWDGARFRHLDNTGRMWTYSTLTANASRSVAYSWYDSDPAGTGTHETDQGPAAEFTQVARSYLRVSTDAPYDTGGNDDPDSVRIWFEDTHLQPDLGAGVTSAVYEIPASGGGSKAPSFATAGTAAAYIASEDPNGWQLNGDGTATQEREPEQPNDLTNKDYVDGKTATPTVLSPFVAAGSGIVIQRQGNRVCVDVTMSRPSGSTIGWTVAATVPYGYRPSDNQVSPALQYWGSTTQYQVAVFPSGDLSCRMQGANSGAITTTLFYETADPMPT